jgi:ABC-2 type transport system permease protein
MTGFSILLRKELREAWRTRRLPVVALLFVGVGVLSPLTARYLNEILGVALGDQLPLALPAPSPLMAVEQLQKNMGQLGALAAIALAMGAVSGELDRGTAALVLAQPVGRPAFLIAKLSAIAAVLGICVALATAVAWTYTTILFEVQPIGGWAVMAVLSWLGLLAWAAITFVASTATGSTTAAAGIGFVALIALSLVAIVPALDRLLPSGLVAPSIGLAAGGGAAGAGVDMAALGSAVAGTIVLIAACAGGAVVAFRRREL